MAEVTKWVGVEVNVESARATGVPITDISQGSPAVLTHGGSNPVDGAYVLLLVQGMSQLDARVVRVDNAGAGSFELEGIDSSEYSEFGSGTFYAITLGVTASSFTNLSTSGGDFSFDDVTTISDKQAKEVPTLPSAIKYNFEMIWDPADLGSIALEKASENQSLLAMRFKFANGRIVVFIGYIGFTNLPGGQAKATVKTQAVVTMFGRPVVYIN